MHLLFPVSFSWSNILKLIYPERTSANYFYVTRFINVLYILLAYNSASTWRYRTNTGPPKEQIKNLSSCHWNVNSLKAHTLSKISLLEAYDTIYKHEFLCISETYLDYLVLEGDRNMQLNGYNKIRADHPSNAKRCGVSIFYKKTLSFCVVNFSNLSESIIRVKLFKTIKVILVLYIDLQTKMLMSFEFFCQNLKQF